MLEEKIALYKELLASEKASLKVEEALLRAMWRDNMPKEMRAAQQVEIRRKKDLITVFSEFIETLESLKSN
ncbi:hypothetical protein [Marinobacterium sp. BA1]|jgi:hypothetical protein|uniref:hypothetical protein n=1 Tax=Marinobacterium sp. BA1 TaxID=3138931 RepID=UPI0032E6AC2B